jgi:hypothetical protein
MLTSEEPELDEVATLLIENGKEKEFGSDFEELACN